MKFLEKIIFFFFLISISLFAQVAHTLSVETRTKHLPFGLTEQVPVYIPKVAIALSGGGSRGLSQIGILKALEKGNIPIDIIVGTSMGSVIGGLYSAGYSIDDIDSIAKNTDWDDLLASSTNRKDLFVDQKITEDKAIFALRLKGFTPIIPTSLNNGQRLSNFLNLLVFQAPIHPGKSFDNLKYKYRAVCTDLVTGNPIILDKGSLSQAMRASSSVSFLMQPVKIDSLTLVDGGLVANIPVEISSKMGGDFIIAINTTSPLHDKESLNFPWIVADQIISIPIKLLNQEQLDNANVVIDPHISSIEAADFSKADSIIKKGYDFTATRLDEIKSKIDSIYNNNIKKNTEKFFVRNILFDENLSHFGKDFYRKYSLLDSVSSFDILKYMSNAFKSGNYKSLKAKIIDYGNKASVDFIVNENPEIKNIEVIGVTLFDAKTINSVFSSLRNTPFNGEKILSKIIRFLKFYRDKGYSLANLDSLNFNGSTGNLKFYFNEGRVDEVIIKGNLHTNNSVIEREFPIKNGDYFLYKEAEEGLVNLRSTNLFDDINLSVKERNNKKILVLSVLERTSSILRFGFRVDDEDKAQFSLDLRDENFFGTGTEIGMLLFGGSRNRAYVFEQKANRIFNTYLTYKLNAFYQFDDAFSYKDDIPSSDKKFSRSIDGEYRQIYYGASLALGTQVEKFGNLIFKGTYKFDELKSKQGATPASFKTKIVSLRISSTIDTQNKYPYPTKGFYFSGFYETAQKILGGEIGYTNISFDYKSYFTVDDVSTFSPRVMMGFADRTLPITEQYSLGGQEMFFGMRKDEFRGRQIFLTSLSYRYKLPVDIFFDTYIGVRYDLGSTWPVQEQIRLKDLRHGIGATLSFDTPIGPADFSVGKSFLLRKNLPGNPLSWGETLFYFSIGYFY